jgi:hypothetical protein
MTQSSSQPGYNRISPFRLPRTDLVRLLVIASFTISIIGITYISMAAGYGTIVPQLFYFPILYATYFYPDRGLYVAGICAVAYLIIAVSVVTLDPMIIGGIIFQALLFVGIAAGSGFVLRSKEISSYTVPEEDVNAIQAMLRTGENDHVEFKLQSLWSADLTKEQISESDSAEVRKYRTNAS